MPRNFHGFERSSAVAPSQVPSQLNYTTFSSDQRKPAETQQNQHSLSPGPTSKFLLPEETLPRGEVGALEESVLQDPFHPAQSLDHVRAIIVQVPEFAIVALVRPPERVLLQHLETRASRSLTWLH